MDSLPPIKPLRIFSHISARPHAQSRTIDGTPQVSRQVTRRRLLADAHHEDLKQARQSLNVYACDTATPRGHAMSGDEDYIANKREGRTYVSREIPVGKEGDRAVRYLSTVLEDGSRGAMATVEGEVVVRTTRSGKQQIKAVVHMDDRQVRTLTLQRWNIGAAGEVPVELMHFSLVGDEVDTLLQLALVAKSAEFGGPDKVRLDSSAVAQFEITPAAAKALLHGKPEVIAQLAEDEDLHRDVVATAYRRNELARFERLLGEPEYFDAELAEGGFRGPEALWQAFFERNRWIFGYGLFHVATDAFDASKLEQTVAGATTVSHGKRVDALLRTKGRVGALCFVEIKTHRTELLQKKDYRPSVWAISDELAGAIAQVQKTVDLAERSLQRVLRPTDSQGAPTGEVSFLLRPRSVVVCGNLAEFETDFGINEEKYTSFELLRRHLIGPEVLTFDELLERARMIVEAA